MHTNTPSIASTALNASRIPDINFDGSKARSTFWLAVLAPVLMAATFITMLSPERNFSHIAGGVCMAVLVLLLSQFPTSASSRFITFNFKRPTHFIPSAIGLGVASTLAVLSAAQIDFTGAFTLSANSAGHFAALFMAVSIATAGRYAMNFVAMTERLMVLLFCWGGSAMVEDSTLLAVGVVGLALNVLWHIQSRWVPQVRAAVVKPTM